MEAGIRFVIPFAGLTKGVHEFEFEVGNAFFKQFENSEIDKGMVDVLVVMDKKDHMLMIDFTMDGTLILPCDRCTEDMELPVTGFNEMVFKFGNETGEESENVVVIPEKDHELDLTQYIYEFIALLVPLRHIHPDDETGKSTCDEEALKQIEKYKVHDEENPHDPRWDVLKNINLN